MKCPACGKPTRVEIVRQYPTYVYRRRECKGCKLKTTTTEKIVGQMGAMSIPVHLVADSVHDFLTSLGIDPTDIKKPLKV